MRTAHFNRFPLAAALAAAALSLAQLPANAQTLQAFYTFEPGTITGTSVADQSGNNRTATLTSGAAAIPQAAFGAQGVEMNNGFFQLPTIGLGQQFSIATFFALTTTASQLQVVVANSIGGGNVSGLRCFVNQFNTANRIVRVETGNGAANNFATTSVGAFPADAGYHSLVFTVNRATGTAQIFLDGVQATTDTSILTNFADTGAFRFGAVNDGFFSDNRFDNIQVFSGLLSQPQVTAFNTTGNALTVAVPEAGTLALLLPALGILGAVVVRRRK